MNFKFRKATKKERKLRLAISGPSGSGKTYTALSIGCALGNKVALIDTEGSPESGGSAELYADFFDFDCVVLPSYSPATYIDAVKAACEENYDVIIIDSLSHAWFGAEGALEQVNKEMARSGSRNSYTAWRNVTPLHNALVQTILHANAHLICTMRAKEKYVMEQDEKGRNQVKKMGMEAIQREGMAYEFDMFAAMDADHNMIVEKTRIGLDGDVIAKPGKDLAKKLLDFLAGSPAVEEKATDQPTAQVSDQPTDQVPDKPAPKKTASVRELLDKVPLVMEKLALIDVNEAIETANTLISVEFECKLEDIPEESAGALATFLNGKMLKNMREYGMVK